MFEGPSRIGAPEDQLPEPFDYLAEAEKLRREREEREKAEKEAKELAKKAEREEKLAKQAATSAAKRKEKVRKISESKDNLKDKVEQVKDEIEDAKEEAKEIEDEIKNTADAPVEMKFDNGSEYVDDELKEGSEAVFELNESIDRAEEAVNTADEVLARAEAINKARAAIHAVETGIEEEVAGIVEPQQRKIEQTIYDLGADRDELRNRFEESWTAEHSEPATREAVPTAISDSSSDYRLPSVVPNIEVPLATVDPVPVPERVSAEPRIVSNIRNGAAFVGGLFAGRAASRRESLSDATDSLEREALDLRTNVEQIQQAASLPVPEALPIEAPKQETAVPQPSIGNIERRPQAPAASFGEALQQTRRGPEVLLSPAIPRWIHDLEAELKRGRVPEIKKWQRDVLRVQHPDILKRYEKLDNGAAEVIRTNSPETMHKGKETQEIKPLSDFDPEYNESARQPSSMPAFMRNSPSVPQMAYSYQQPGPKQSSVLTDNFATIVMIGGAIFGAVLIIAFGF